MGYFKALAGTPFKKDDNGRDVFFLWGVLGRGFEIPSEAESERLRRWFARTYMVILPMIILLVVSRQLWISLLLVLFYGAGYALWVRRFAKAHRQSEMRLSIRESFTNQARGHSPRVLWLLLFGSLLMVACSVLVLILEPSKWLVPMGGLVFFGGGASFFAWMLLTKRKLPAE